jgi:prepilin-type processing-associated H-X9-DG protein
LAAYDPPHKLNETPMPIYVCPSDPRGFVRQASHGRWVALTSYVGNFGTDVDTPDGVLIFAAAIRPAMITDGLSNTILAGERPASTDMWYGWWYTSYGQRGTGNADMLLGAREINTFTNYASDCPPGPYVFQKGRFDQQCDLFHYWSPHAGGANFAFADGSTRFLRYGVVILPILATRAGGESVE